MYIMKRTVFFILLLFVSYGYSDQPDTAGIFNSGMQQYQKGNYDEAVKLFDIVISSAAKNEKGIVQKAYLAQADALLDGLKLDEAYKGYSRFIEKYPKGNDTLAARLGIGLVYYKKNNYAKAREYLVGLIKKYSGTKIADDAQFWLGMLHFKNKNYKKAIISFTALASNYSKSDFAPEGLLRLGDSYYNLKKYPFARESYRKIIRKYPDAKQCEFALYNIGRSYDTEGAVQDAITIYTQYADRYPFSTLSAEVVYKIANHYYKNKQIEKAKNYYKQLFTDFSDSELAEEAHFIYAKIVYESGDNMEALNLFNECAQAYGSSGKCYFYSLFYAGNCFMNMGDYKNAVKIFEETLRNEEINPEVAASMRYNCGIAYENLRQIIKAEKMFNEILYRLPKSLGAAKIYIKRGTIFECNGDIMAAIENYELASTISKNKDIKRDDLLFNSIEGELGAEAQKRAADCYFSIKKYKEAAREYLKVVYLFSDSALVPEAQFMAGCAVEASGLLEEAKSNYEIVKNKYPETEWSKKAKEKIELLNNKVGRK